LGILDVGNGRTIETPLWKNDSLPPSTHLAPREPLVKTWEVLRGLWRVVSGDGWCNCRWRMEYGSDSCCNGTAVQPIENH
jgi:hypothetical protein